VGALGGQRGQLVCALLVDYPLLVQDQLLQSFWAIGAEQGQWGLLLRDLIGFIADQPLREDVAVVGRAFRLVFLRLFEGQSFVNAGDLVQPNGALLLVGKLLLD
jgi:hypothetical protein